VGLGGGVDVPAARFMREYAHKADGAATMPRRAAGYS
jgi:hypothetical protein